MKSLIPKQKIRLLLLGLITLGGGLNRFYNLNWDEGHFFHPDERNIAWAVTRIHFFDQLNPQFFAYGSWPIYLYRIFGEIAKAVSGDAGWVSDWGKINLLGRFNSALVSTVTIVLIYWLGKKIWNINVALVAAFLTAFSPFLIQLAHFSIMESLLNFWLVLLVIISILIKEKPGRTRYWLLGGLVLGMAAATKISAVSFAIIPAAAFFLSQPGKQVKRVVLAGLTTVGVFVLTSPFVFLDKTKFLESMRYESGVVWGKLAVPYTLQFDKTWPYVYQLANLIWLMGPVCVAAVLGIVYLAIKTGRTKRGELVIFLIFPLVYFGYIGSWHTKFVRYTSPLLPFFILAAAVLICQAAGKKKAVATGLVIVLLGSSLGWTLAFSSVYRKESSRITASEWIYENITGNSKILTEHWDDGLPVAIGNHRPSLYRIEALTVYEADNEDKTAYYADKLAGAEYMIINSRRLYGTLMHLPEKYPLTGHYYRLLFAGQLGYQKVAEFSSYPSFFGLDINDDFFEETVQVYDHPRVMILKNVQRLSQEEIAQRLGDVSVGLN